VNTMRENYEVYLKEIHKKYENVSEAELLLHWRTSITTHLAAILNLSDSLKTLEVPAGAEIVDEETLNLLTVEGEKALVEIDFIVQYVERLRQEKSNHETT
jgi:hypothetical protein